jgi:LmbE family N-acetylglucosaminyl deacetylase
LAISALIDDGGEVPVQAAEAAAGPDLLQDPAAILAAYGLDVARLTAVPAARSAENEDSGLAGLVDEGMPVVVLAPHLGDAVLSCGALLTYAVSRTQVTVVTFFTEAGQAPYTWSARWRLRKAGERDAEAVYQRRRTQDRAALEPLGITCVHAGLTEAPFRRRPAGPGRSPLARLRPGSAHIYPSYRAHVTSGQVVAADAGTLREVREIIHRVAGSGLPLVLAPLGAGGHVDHILVRNAALSSGAPVAFYREFPHNQRDCASDAFIYRHGLAEAPSPEPGQAKAELIRAYESQLRTQFRGAEIPLLPEAFFSAGRPCAAASSAWWR